MPREPRRDYLYLADIIDSARTVARWLAERDGQWDDDEILRNAVLRQLSVIGEAASSPLRGRIPRLLRCHVMMPIAAPLQPRLQPWKSAATDETRRCARDS